MSITSCISCRLCLASRRWWPFEVNLWTGNRKRKLLRSGGCVRTPMEHFMHRGWHSLLGFFVRKCFVCMDDCYQCNEEREKFERRKVNKCFLSYRSSIGKHFRRTSLISIYDVYAVLLSGCTNNKPKPSAGCYLPTADPIRWLRWHASWNHRLVLVRHCVVLSVKCWHCRQRFELNSL